MDAMEREGMRRKGGGEGREKEEVGWRRIRGRVSLPSPPPPAPFASIEQAKHLLPVE